MLDPTQTTVHLDPSTLRLLWGALVALVGLLGTAMGLALRGQQAARAWSRRSDRQEATDDHVHGPGRTREPPRGDAPGLVDRVEQLEDAAHRTAHELDLHRRKLRLPDPNDEQEVLMHLAEHVTTGNWPAIEEHRAQARRPVEERPQPLPAPRPRPRHRGEPE